MSRWLRLLVVGIGGCQAAAPVCKISREEAEARVWALPEVSVWQEEISRSGRDDVKLISMTEQEVGSWMITLYEDHPEHTVRRGTFHVDASTGEVCIDKISGESANLSRIKEELSRWWDDSEFCAIEVRPLLGSDSLFVANCEWQKNWWGTLVAFEFREDRIQWIRALDITEQSVLRYRQIDLQPSEYPVIEVFGKTHMGHGSLYLFELRPREPVLRLECFAVDFHHDENLIRGGVLDVGYADRNGDGASDVVLDGIIDVVAEAVPALRVFLWDPSREAFVEDDSARQGFAEVYGSRLDARP
jgi:hypothetical protein